MRYFKIISGNHVASVGTGSGGEETSEEEYNIIMTLIRNKPAAQAGYVYRLRADTLAWELVELPPAPPPSPDDELSDTEALSLITGGTI